MEVTRPDIPAGPMFRNFISSKISGEGLCEYPAEARTSEKARMANFFMP
jgi:hypothetical protein